MRKLEENFFKILMIGSCVIVTGSLALILWSILRRGLPAMSLDMVSSVPKGGFYMGGEGGILNAIVGSLLLASGASVLAFLLSLPVSIGLNVYLRRGSRLASFARFSLDVLNGVPSIVYGAFGFALMLFFGLKASLLAGIITVALLILPIMCRAMDEVFQMVPKDMMDVSHSLGATRLQAALSVLTRQALPGITTAILISFGRGIGDAASVLFTAGYSDNLPSSVLSPVASLPLAIFFQLGTPVPEVQDRAYASALILTTMILLLSIGARVASRKLSRNIIK
ncbi:MAG: phosphate ABC transporter permease [Lentisphaerae bacterium GWF2_52_8]|nr:MAG: phosphate ABC transporter permease [Lentisphaerae bacterium GWF2_52_8]